jgi:hypothetical protein
MAWQDNVPFTTLARLLSELTGVDSANGRTLADRYIVGYTNLFSEYLDRAVTYRERVKYYDVDQPRPIVHLNAWPIGRNATSGDPLVEVVNDVSASPTWSTPLTYPEQYRVYGIRNEDDEGDQGKIQFLVDIYEGFRCLRVTWTGGMATRTIVEGTDGALTNPVDGELSSASATFETDLVEVGMTVTATDGTNTETKEIKSVDSETKITVDGTWLGGLVGTGRAWIVNEAGLVGLYPDLEQAMIAQCVFHWKQRGKIDVEQMSVMGAGGMNVQYTKFKPFDLLPEVIRVLNNHRLTVYP